MALSGKNLISGQWLGDVEQGFCAMNAIDNVPMNTMFANATSQEVELAISSANRAFESYSQLAAKYRAQFLRTIGEQIIALGDELVDAACAETGLPAQRIQGERGRTVGQLNLFADLLDEQEYQPVIDQADNNRAPLPKPDTRLGYLPLGVVAVFGASNFPLAFSTAGGDTASALAAGCPVVMKAHTAHPATAELVAQAILSAITLCELDPGVFSLIQGTNHDISSEIITHPLVKAVGFTGSERVGMIFQNQINQRPEPIPFYGELGSINPQFILPAKLKYESSELAANLVASLMMGQGQFCTSPGVWFVLESEGYQSFIESAINEIQGTQAGVMLTPDIAQAYRSSIDNWHTLAGVSLLGQGEVGPAHFCRSALFGTDLSTFLATNSLQDEVFGASALIVRCKNIAEMLVGVNALKGNLTATIHAHQDDMDNAKELAKPLVHKVGRLIYNQMPTGVEVCASMNHGGPFPASTNIRSTSVGSEAIKRFQRPICYQNMPNELLPELLKR